MEGTKEERRHDELSLVLQPVSAKKLSKQVQTVPPETLAMHAVATRCGSYWLDHAIGMMNKGFQTDGTSIVGHNSNLRTTQ